MFPHNHSQFYMTRFQQDVNFYNNHGGEATSTTTSNENYYDFHNQHQHEESEYDFPKTGKVNTKIQRVLNAPFSADFFKVFDKLREFSVFFTAVFVKFR